MVGSKEAPLALLAAVSASTGQLGSRRGGAEDGAARGLVVQAPAAIADADAAVAGMASQALRLTPKITTR
jgi:hypothetical protein